MKHMQHQSGPKQLPDGISETDYEGSLSRDQLEVISDRPGKEFSVGTPGVGGSDAIIRGRFHNFRCHSGMTVHATDTVELHDLETSSMIPPNLSVAVFLKGRLDLELGNRRFTIGGGEAPSGSLWMVTRREKFRRIAAKGTRVKKVIVSLPPTWLLSEPYSEMTDEAALKTLFNTHRAMRNWTPPDRVLALAEQIIALKSGSRLLRCMAAEAKGIEIVMAALAHVVENAMPENAGTEASLRALSKARQIRDHIVEHSAGDVGLEALASRFGMSVASLQRAFKATYGKPVNEYLREYRLSRARGALAEQGISVSEAAYLAGYNNPANFATAFRKKFGIAPSKVRG